MFVEDIERAGLCSWKTSSERARFYDAALGRWNVIDPMAEKFFDNGSYNYVINRPTIAIDPDGQDIVIIFRSGTGQNIRENSVKYGSDGKLYDTKTNKEYNSKSGTGEENAYFNDVKGTLDNLKSMGGVVSEVVGDLIDSEADHKIANQSSKAESPISMTVNDLENSKNEDKRGTLTLYDPAKDRVAGIKFTVEEVLGHELRHAYNRLHDVKNAGLSVYEKRVKPLNDKYISGEEVSAVSFQNVIRKYQGYWLLPQTTYKNVDISKQLVVPTLVPQQVPLKNKIVHRRP